MPTPFARYVALGDSSTEGLDDPLGDGRYRGWADRLAAHVARAQAHHIPEAPPLHYANLAIRGRKTREVRDEQLAPALAMRPDLATLFVGTNDVIQGGFQLAPVIADLREMQQALRGAGATLLTITMPDLSAVVPMARRIAPNLAAFNQAVRDLCAETGTIVVDLAAHAWVTDPRFWSSDRLHANTEGHTRIAAALAEALGLPGADDAWARPLPYQPPPTALARGVGELRWVTAHLIPWAVRHALGRSSGDGITAKRPTLTPVEP